MSHQLAPEQLADFKRYFLVMQAAGISVSDLTPEKHGFDAFLIAFDIAGIVGDALGPRFKTWPCEGMEDVLEALKQMTTEEKQLLRKKLGR